MNELEREVASLRAEIESLKVNVLKLKTQGMDHEQRFDTLQSWWWKRLYWWAVEGWPWHDLNAERPAWRPWTCEGCARRKRRLKRWIGFHAPEPVIPEPCGGCNGD